MMVEKVSVVQIFHSSTAVLKRTHCCISVMTAISVSLLLTVTFHTKIQRIHCFSMAMLSVFLILLTASLLLNNMQASHFCISKATVVTRTISCYTYIAYLV